jgi:hypothetical protein
VESGDASKHKATIANKLQAISHLGTGGLAPPHALARMLADIAQGLPQVVSLLNSPSKSRIPMLWQIQLLI